MKLKPGDAAPAFEAITTTGSVLTTSQLKGKFTILSFHRYVGCPLCNLAIRSFSKQAPGVLQSGLNIVNIFESNDANLKQALTIWGDMDYPVIADPTAKLFIQYGVDTSVVGALRTATHPSQVIESLRTPKPPIKKDGSDLRLPASFFLSPDGRVFDLHYGRHAGDHLTPELTERWLKIVARDSAAAPKKPVAAAPPASSL
ncbi:MAG: redoxin domain-containing protein [Myxococcales bacterium]|nr:redoxin domain-containing protein [Myxococcales bacterium]MDP3498869.1 redoxin domain-containing protein [Myxococcales bacterium]